MKPFLVLLLSIIAASAGEPGLNLTLTAGEKSDARTARLAALFVPAGQPVSPFLPAGPFTARFEGSIQSPLRAECTFAAEIAGTLKLTLNGQEVLSGEATETKRIEGKPVKLSKGANALVIEFQSPKQGDAALRLLWLAPEFFPEPVPPAVFERDADSPAVVAGERMREGRLLFAQSRCTACHEAAALLPAKGQGMPELAQDAPLFAEFGARFNEPWLAHWIDNPHAIRPGTLMPRLFAGRGDEVDPRAADLAAYLATLGAPVEEKPLPEEAAPAGGALFANLGCIACHTTPDAEGEDEFKRVPLSHVRAKWHAGALREYLKDPQKTYQWSRMPNFRLSDEEALRLTAYLMLTKQNELAPGPKGDATKGAQLVATAGCLNCHAGLPPTTAPKLPEKWTRGCLAADAAERGSAPDFSFSDAQREALLAFADSGLGSLKQDVPAEFAHRQSANLRCNACHTMDAQASVWSQLDNDVAPLQAGAPVPESEGMPIAGALAPPFTWLGEKLRTTWAADFIAGRNTIKPRPWIIARMPAFATYADALAPGLAHEHGFSTAEPPKPAPDPDQIKAGETLLGENGGFNCLTCHALGARPATAVFEAPGINFALTAERVRYAYYHRWVLFPQRIDPETKMPKFADENGKTPLTDLFDGDANQQYDAIWAYLQAQPGGK